MFIFISGAVNNDNLAIPLSSLTILLMIRMVTRMRAIEGLQASGNCLRSSGYWLHWLLIGVVIGLGILTKEGTFGLIPLAFGTAVISLWQADVAKKDPLPIKNLLIVVGKALLVLLVVLIPILLIAGWWYYRNIVLYGDWLGWSAFIAVLGQRAHPASLVQLWSERQGFMMSFWGLFGGVNVPMPMWIYTLLNTVLIIGVIGFIIYLFQILRNWIQLTSNQISNLQSLISNLLSLVERYFGLVVNLLFALAVIIGLIQWATTTWSSQGRLVFTAMSSLCVLMAIGLIGWLPERPSRYVIGALAGFMFVVALLAPFLWIAPTYAAPVYASPMERNGAQFGEGLRLVGYDISDTAVQPGDTLDLTLEWEVKAEMDRNWSIFVHLTDPVLGRPIAQRDMYHGQGMRPYKFT